MTFSKNDEYAISEMAKLSSEDLIEQIKNISLSSWERGLETITLKSWLNNFTGEFFNNRLAEQNLALWLVLHFVYYTDRDIRSLSVNLWWKFVHSRMEEYEKNGFMSDKTVEEKYKYIVDNTVVLPLGNCAGSGTNVCYFFRQSNGLSKEMFDFKKEDDYRYLVLVDDVTVSGRQAEENLAKYDYITDKEKYILTYISTIRAKSHIGSSATLLSSMELDEKSKCFEQTSYVFSRHKNWINIAKKMCKHYGEKLDPRNPLGYRNGQFLFGFYYNIPNNALPIFWGNLNGWVPLFERFFNDCDKLEETNSEKFF